MRFVSLFAGIGGFDLGFERAGLSCVGQVEIDKKCVEVLDKHWPDVPRHDDVETAREWADERGITGSVDVVCGGFPCQDVSVAGARAGLAGERSGLFFSAVAFAAHTQAETIVLENVPGLLSSNKGRDFGVVLTTLADAGYRHIEWRVLDSQFFGVAQRRRRVFIVASARTPRERAVFVESEGSIGDSQAVQQAGQDVASTLGGGSGSRGWSPDTDRMTFVPFAKSRRAQSDTDYETWVECDSTPTLNTHDNQSGTRATALAIGFAWQNGGGYGNAHDGLAITEEGTGPLSVSQVPAVATEMNVRRLTPMECSRLQGFPDDWNEGLADSHRYKQAGNAVTVPVAQWLGRQLMEAYA